MKKFMLFLPVLFNLCLDAQNNLVENGDFETHVGTISCEHYPAPNSQDGLEEYWGQTPPWAPPKKKSQCLLYLHAVGTADHYCPGGNFGPTYAYMQNREYITAPLSSNLISGKTYYIEFYIKNGSGNSTLENAGIKFSDSRPKQCTYFLLNIDGDPDVEIDNNITFSGDTWTKYVTYYTPDQDYSWLTIGTFNRDEGFEQSFRIDDIKIVEWIPICPTIQLFENWDFTGFQGMLVSAADKLYAGYNVGSPQPNGNVIVQTGSEVRFKAGNEVGLFDGFIAANGSEFHAYNAPCGSECFPPSPVAGIAADICDGSPYEIGEPAGFNEIYSWTSNPSNAINYLSSTTISNPVFTPPSNGSGTITYMVTAINSCGQTGSNSISIHYENNPSSTVQLSLSNITLGDIPSFDVNYDSHVKSVTIEVLDASLSTTYYSENFLDVLDFSCCSFSWSMPVSLSPCIDYKIRVTATNYCTSATSSQIIDWQRNRSVTLTASLPNVITPNGDGVDDEFCFQFTGASSYSFVVNSPSGTPVFIASNVTAYPVSACVWSGECNAPACTGDHVGDGVYFFTLTLNGCDNQPAFSTAGFLELLNGSGRLGVISDSVAAFHLNQNAISVFPNPTADGIINIDFRNQSSRKIELYNSLGQIIQVKIESSSEKNIAHIEGVESGIYFLRMLLDNGSYESKQIIVL
jgi:hypothetical protein